MGLGGNNGGLGMSCISCSLCVLGRDKKDGHAYVSVDLPPKKS